MQTAFIGVGYAKRVWERHHDRTTDSTIVGTHESGCGDSGTRLDYVRVRASRRRGLVAAGTPYGGGHGGSRGPIVPSPWRTATCVECGADWQTRSLTAVTCSPKCRAIRREKYTPSKGAPPREYPTELVERVRELYESGMTRAEVQAAIGIGVKVENIMRRYGIESRPASPRLGMWNGAKNPQWRGDQAGYQALHLRVEAARGKPQHCNRCDRRDGNTRYEWANLNGNYTDVHDYERMCVPCHRTYDAERRRLTGRRTSPRRGVVNYV